MFDLPSMLRWMVPLLAVTLAVACFYRVGVINIAADGTIQLSAALYAAIALHSGPGSAAIVAVLAGCLAGVGITWVIERFGADSVLFTLGTNILFVGVASLVCYWAFNNPGHGPLRGTRIRLDVLQVAVLIAVLLCSVSLVEFRYLRLGIVIGLSEKLALAEGLDLRKIRLLHGCFGGVLLGISGVVLTEMGGSYASTVSGQRGLLGLLVVAASWPHVLRVLWCAPAIGVVQMLILRNQPVIRSLLPGALDVESLLDAVILLGALGVLAWRSRGRWPDGKGSEGLKLPVYKDDKRWNHDRP